MSQPEWLIAKKSRYLPTIEAFLANQLPANDFQSKYMNLMSEDTTPFAPKEVFKVLQEIFYDADAYSELVPLPSSIAIDEAELRRSVKENYDELIALLKQYEK